MSKNTTNTLIGAENVALRAELDDANKKIKTLESGNQQDAGHRKTIDALTKTIAGLTKNAALDKKRISELAAGQLSAAQTAKLRDYDRMNAVSNDQSGKFSAVTSDFNQATAKLEEASKQLEDKDESIKELNLTVAKAQTRRKTYKRRMLAGIVASVFFAAIIGGGSYYYVETELTPANALSPEASDAFKKHAPEFRKIISDATAGEREQLRMRNDELASEKKNLDRDKPGWFSSYGMPVIYVIGGIIFGFLIGLGTVMKLIK
jgi:vacuolar-type H+-ATPase subunit I/STV1